MGVEECILHSHMGIGEMGIEAFYYYVISMYRSIEHTARFSCYCITTLVYVVRFVSLGRSYG